MNGDTDGFELFGVPRCRLFPAVVGIVSEAHRVEVGGFDRLEEFTGEALRPVNAGRVFHPVADEGQGVDDRFAEDDFRAFERVGIEDPVMRSGQIEVVRRSLPQAPGDLAAVNFPHVSGAVDDGEDDRAVEVLVAAVLAEHAEFLQAFADCRTFLAVLLGKPQAERPVGEADPEAADKLLVIEPAAGEVVEGGFRLGQPLVVVVAHLVEHRSVVRVEIERTRQLRNGRLFRPLRRRVLEGGLAAVEQLEGVAEAHAVELLHELDRVARRAAGHAMIKPFGRADDEVGAVVVVVERAPAHEVLAAVFAKLDAARADESEQVGVAFHAGDVVVGDPRHVSFPSSG